MDFIVISLPFCRLFKDVQIDTFVKLMDSEDLGHMLAQCEVVREFRGSGRALVKATDMCSVEQVQAAVDRSVVLQNKPIQDIFDITDILANQNMKLLL